MAVQITTTLFDIPQPLSVTFTQGILRVESTKTRVLVQGQIYYNRILTGTSVKSRYTGINIFLFLVLITYSTEISYLYLLFINIPTCYVASLGLKKGPQTIANANPAWAGCTTAGLAALPLVLSTHKTDINFYRCTVHSDVCGIHSPTKALLII